MGLTAPLLALPACCLTHPWLKSPGRLRTRDRVCTCGEPPGQDSRSPCPARGSPWWFRTVRQPMQQLRRWAKASRPPTLPVSTVLHRVWSPPASEDRPVGWVSRVSWGPLPLYPYGPPHSYAAVRPRRGLRPGWAQRCAGVAWPAVARGNTVCRWAGCAPARKGGPVSQGVQASSSM